MAKKSYASHVSRKQTPQTEPIPGQEARQAKNNAGGYSYVVDDWCRLDRFLILGNDSNTYYVTPKDITKESAAVVERCAAADFTRTLSRVVAVSDGGIAAKTDAQIFALAILASRGNPETDTQALARLSEVCRIPTHLYTFTENIKHLRGRGRSVRTALQQWLLDKDARTLAYQASKYAQRDGWAMRDVLRLAKPKTDDPETDGVFGWVVGKPKFDVMPDGEAKTLLQAVDRVKTLTDPKEIARMVRDHRLVREVLPTQSLNSTEVWEALLEEMPVGALIRNLGKMSEVGLLVPRSNAAKHARDMLTNEEALRKARIHPFGVLLAHTTYAAGRGFRGTNTWDPVPSVIDALDDAFYKSFRNVQPTGKRLLFALDVSGSMTSPMMGSHLTCRDASAALAMIHIQTEPEDVDVIGFTAGGGWYGRRDASAAVSGIQQLAFSKKQRLANAVKTVSGLSFGGTDCALPFMWAESVKRHYDAIVVITDNETWAGNIHPSQAMTKYRQWAGHNVKEAVIGLASNGFSIADPSDPNAMDFVGFAADGPAILSDFICK